MVLSSSCSCLFSQNSSVLLTKSCVHMCAYVREREREPVSVCHCLCPQALHEHLSIPQYLRLEYENRKLFHHSTTMRTYGHKADGECQKLSGKAKEQWQSTADYKSKPPGGDRQAQITVQSQSHQSNIKWGHFKDLISPWIWLCWTALLKCGIGANISARDRI